MTHAEQLEQACMEFLEAPLSYLVLVDAAAVPRIWCLRDGDGNAVVVGDCYSLTQHARDCGVPLLTVH